MIITRTPYRISFFGGGADYHTWYQKHGAVILSTTINHYCYLSCRQLPPFFKHKSRITWSKIEEVVNNNDIIHPSVNAVLKYLNIDYGVEINHQGDLPARSGLGSSSAFTVGLLNAIYGLENTMASKKQLACESIYVERHILKENVGVQDQIATAYGGLNKITISTNGEFIVEPIILNNNRLHELESHLLLFFTGVSRTASNIAESKIKNISSGNKENTLFSMQDLVSDAINLLTSNEDIRGFGKLLDKTWQLKKNISNNISTNNIDYIYNKAMDAGSLGGKILGAGGGGFILFFAEPKKHEKIKESLSDLLHVPFNINNNGSQIIFFDQHKYSQSSKIRRDYSYLQEDNKFNQKLLSIPLVNEV